LYGNIKILVNKRKIQYLEKCAVILTPSISLIREFEIFWYTDSNLSKTIKYLHIGIQATEVFIKIIIKLK